MMVDSRRYPVARIGVAARRALAPGAAGRVVAVFRRSFYVETANGALACIGPEAMGAGPLNALARLPADCDWVARGLRPGAPARVENDVLRVGHAFAFSLASAADWRPATMPSEWQTSDLARGLRHLVTWARPSAEGLAPLVPVLAVGAFPLVAGEPLLRLARPSLVALAGWLGAAATEKTLPPEVPDAVTGLIGLGPGLTPSGDDCLGGAMIALHGFGLRAAAGRLAATVLPRAATETGTISCAHLAAAAEGAGAAALHDALAALARADEPALEAALAALDAIGHCSGWDALAGAIMVGAALGRAENQPRARRQASLAAAALDGAT